MCVNIGVASTPCAESNILRDSSERLRRRYMGSEEAAEHSHDVCASHFTGLTDRHRVHSAAAARTATPVKSISSLCVPSAPKVPAADEMCLCEMSSSAPPASPFRIYVPERRTNNLPVAWVLGRKSRSHPCLCVWLIEI